MLLDKQFVKSTLPSGISDLDIAESMKEHFQGKVQRIYDNISNEIKAMPYQHSKCQQNLHCELNSFMPYSTNDVHKLIKSMSTKFCDLDPITPSLLLNCIEELLPIITFIVNESLQEGRFPHQLKTAIVKPCLKKHNLDCDMLQNYRPISNLAFLSKVIEKAVHEQLTEYLTINKLHAENQSGYRKYHSCETATIKIHSDLLTMVDSRNQVVLLLLDLSAAFDTLNHEILLKKLKANYNISGLPLEWFASYLKERNFSVKINRSTSGKSYLLIGVPQGSILGPILFILYTKELEEIAKKHGYSIHLYADDTQLYISFSPIQPSAAIEESVVSCVNDIKRWMTTNYLKLNDDKTELIIIKPTTLSHTSITSININGELIQAKTAAKSLGVYFDSTLNMSHHVKEITQACYMNLRNLWMISYKLHFRLKIQLVHSLILSRLDYCNGILYGILDHDLKEMQKVQNAAVRFIFGKEIKKFDHISPYLKLLHFLPVKYRIMFKIALLCFKCLNNIAPEYLKDIVTPKMNSLMNLRIDEDAFLLEVPQKPQFVKSEKAFYYAGPAIWNALPYSIRSSQNVGEFKVSLKTHYFLKAFEGVTTARTSSYSSAMN